MSRRFYSAQPLCSQAGLMFTLDGSEAHHLAHVMRAKPGDQITVFDGVGWEATAIVESVGRRDVQLQIATPAAISRELPFELELAVALPRGERQEWLVEKIVEVGVTRLVPLNCERSVARPNDKSLDKLRRAVIEASKQCGRNHLMEVAAVADFPSYISAANGRRWFAHVMASSRCTDPAQPAAAIRSDAETQGSQEPITIAVGPEGGFSDDEATAAANAGWQLVTLGSRILRTETAAIALALAAQS